MTDQTTRHFEVNGDELLIVVNALMTRLFDIEVHEFLTGWGGGTNEAEKAALDHRLQDIRAAVGDEAVDKVRTEVEERFRRQLGERYWHILKHGSQEEKDKVAEEWDQGHRPLDASAASLSKGKVEFHSVISGEHTKGWVHTHGMDVLGLPELEIRECPGFFVEAAAHILRSVCDYMLESKKAVKSGENMEISGNTIFGFAKPDPIPGSEDHYEVERLQIVEAECICDECSKSSSDLS